jgi:hypothetical protein
MPIAEEAHEEIRAQLRDTLPAAHVEFLKSLRPSASAGGYFFAHAGVNPAKPLSEQVGDDLYWIREPFLGWDRPLEKVVVHGHTPVEEPEVHGSQNRRGYRGICDGAADLCGAGRQRRAVSGDLEQLELESPDGDST